MKNIIKIKAQKLTEEAFEPFGQVVLGANGKPNYKEATWESLFPAAKVHIPEGELGWVITKKPKGGMVVKGMEREPEIEMIWPVDKPIIQVVSPTGRLKTMQNSRIQKRQRLLL
jgi:hypothetical protein